jgi:Uncharacterized alpha/beta hydrolase domain (DUF2235)
MRRLVVCCDGTWNTSEQMRGDVPCPTNVVRIFHALEQSADQLCYYHPGVGTGAGLMDKLAGGSFGTGLSNNVKSAYAWLAANYRPGGEDAICLFGFSRGAFTVRSLAGMIGACGLPSFLADAEPADRWKAIDALFAAYRPGAVVPDERAVPIMFLGVWDTVGALGVPASMGLLRIAEDLGHNAPHFHDTRLGARVRHARHAVAMDEKRGPFVPTLWTNLPLDEPGRTAEQVWFAGDHCDVGGGHPQTGLSDCALSWMIKEAQSCVPELRFRPDILAQIRPDPADVLHDDSTGFYRFLGPTPRATPFLDPRSLPDDPPEGPGKDTIDDVHVSAYRRQAVPPIAIGDYRKGRVPDRGETVSLDVYAVQPWNWTGLYLVEGEYELKASGEWLDRTGPHNADGTQAGRSLPDMFHLTNAAAGWLQESLKNLTRDEAVTFFGSPRLRGARWMALIGALAAPAFDHAGSQMAYRQFAIPTTGSVLHVAEGAEGYFYAYANDAWGMYGDNRGSLSLTIKRTA